MSVMKKAEDDFLAKYGMTPDECREKFMNENNLTFEKLSKLPMDDQAHWHYKYQDWKEQFTRK